MFSLRYGLNIQIYVDELRLQMVKRLQQSQFLPSKCSKKH
jgi:hypothetical protein